MLIRMELNLSVRLFLTTECFPEEVEAFRVLCDAIREDPIGNTDPYMGASDSPYQLRYFRFGGCQAFIEYHWTGDIDTELIRVVACKRRRIKPAR